MSALSLIDVARITYEAERAFDATFGEYANPSWEGSDAEVCALWIQRVIDFLESPERENQLDIDPLINARNQLFGHTVTTLVPLVS